MEIEEKDVKVKMSVCPECGNAIRVAVEHTMTIKSKNEFAEEVMKHDLQVKTISLEEYRSSNIQLYCKESCSRYRGRASKEKSCHSDEPCRYVAGTNCCYFNCPQWY